jgi:hypothetical protein
MSQPSTAGVSLISGLRRILETGRLRLSERGLPEGRGSYQNRSRPALLKKSLTLLQISFGLSSDGEINPSGEADEPPTLRPVADDTSLPVKSAVEEFPVQIENDTEQTKSSLETSGKSPCSHSAKRRGNAESPGPRSRRRSGPGNCRQPVAKTVRGQSICSWWRTARSMG